MRDRGQPIFHAVHDGTREGCSLLEERPGVVPDNREPEPEECESGSTVEACTYLDVIRPLRALETASAVHGEWEPGVGGRNE